MKPNLPTGNLVKNKSFKNISKDVVFWFLKNFFYATAELGKDKKPANCAICKDKPRSQER